MEATSEWHFFPGLSRRSLKLSQFGLPGLWALITSCSDLGLGWGLRKSCNSLWELFNAMSHSFCRRQIWVDSWLLVVGSQTTSLTPGPSFAHNLGYKCPNGSCEAILDIYTSRPFQWYKKHPNASCFDPCNRALSFWESQRSSSSHTFGSVSFILTLNPKWGCDTWSSQDLIKWLHIYRLLLSDFKHLILFLFEFQQGFIRLKHWKHINFFLEEINYSELQVIIYECCKVEKSTQRFCFHGATNVKMYELKCSFGSRIIALKKWNFVLFANNTSFTKSEVVE